MKEAGYGLEHVVHVKVFLTDPVTSNPLIKFSVNSLANILLHACATWLTWWWIAR